MNIAFISTSMIKQQHTESHEKETREKLVVNTQICRELTAAEPLQYKAVHTPNRFNNKSAHMPFTPAQFTEQAFNWNNNYTYERSHYKSHVSKSIFKVFRIIQQTGSALII